MRGLVDTAMGKLNLPEEVLEGAARLTLTGGSRLRIENHRCLLSFSGETLEVSCRKQTLRVRGENLRIISMDRCELIVDGLILAVEVDPG